MTDFEKICDFSNLYRAYKKVKRGKGNKSGANKFNCMAIDGIIRLKRQLETKEYKLSPYYEFTVYEPKERLIKASSFNDKIVQHSLCDNILLPKLQDIFIRNSFAGQKSKGTLFGLNTLRADMKSFGNKYNGNGFILKADISKFFYSIDHELLKQEIYKYFSDENIKWLCNLIIDSTEGKGLPLGNQTSQVFALLFLDGLDKFIINNLHIEYYGRYMDDLYIFHRDKDYLKYCLQEIKNYLIKLQLKTNGKTQIIPFKNGLKFLGFYSKYQNGIVISKVRGKNKRNAYRKYTRFKKLVESGKRNQKQFTESLQSYKAHLQFGDCKNLISEINKKYIGELNE